MAILENEVLIALNPINIVYYEKLNYYIPRIKDSYGRIRIPRGTKILVKIDDLPIRSNVKVTKVCDECGEHVNQTYENIYKSRENGDGKDRCKKCSRKKGSISRKNNVKFENSLLSFANNNRKYLLEEFSVSNKKKPIEISFATHDEFLWNCSKCESEYTMKVSNRTSGKQNCPYCAGIKVNHKNCLWTTHPEMARLLKDEERGYAISAGRNKKEEFKCCECGHEQKKIVSNVVNQGFSCHCSDGVSYPEKFMANLLNQLEVKYESQKAFNWSTSKKYDFYIPSLNCIIETHGGQHYSGRFEFIGGRNLEEEIENDKFKERLASENFIKYYLIIDCRKSDLNFIKNNIIRSSLSELFDLTIINWLKCHEYACNSLVRTVCNLWNDGVKNTKAIGEIVKLSSSTVVKYLHKGRLLGWCDYDPNEVKKQTGMLSGRKNAKAIVQLTMDSKYIKTWESASKAANELGILQGNITAACKGRYKYSGGYKWMYKEGYDFLDII